MIRSIKSFKYLTPFILYVLGLIAFNGNGILCWLPLIYTFFIVPGVELMLKPDAKNLDEVEESLAKSNKIYDIILYFAVIMQYYSLYTFFNAVRVEGITTIDIVGKVMTMGLLCGTFGINVAHELGHRVNQFEQTLAKLLLLTSLYMHFYIDHNQGHHKHVATPGDPSSAKLNQSLYAFWPQTLIGTYMSAWHIAGKALKKKGKSAFSIQNEMLHYGLSRNKTSEESYERVQPHHSWNSNHVIGRLMLFELSRHSDHHYLASRKYQVLRHMDQAPQMPTGYPGMILLSLVPPLWFKVMHSEIKKQGIQV